MYRNISFEEIQNNALAQNSPFCVVLIDSSDYMSKEYISFLEKDYNYLLNSALYNIAEINDESNNWYLKWLCPASIPLTCIFTSNGSLVDLIPGVSKESFLYTEEVIKSLTTSDFHWPNRFNINKKQAVPLLNNILIQKRNIETAIYEPNDIDTLINSLQYPYSYYLKLTGELMVQNTKEARKTAEALINIETPQTMELYRNEFITAKKIFYPDFDIEKEPHIRVDKATIHLSNCKQDETIPLEVLVYNDGHKPLIVEKIHTSCTCLEQHKYNDKIVINPQSSFPIKFYFTPDIKGEMYREIFIASNAINMPILHIDIVAEAI